MAPARQTDGPAAAILRAPSPGPKWLHRLGVGAGGRDPCSALERSEAGGLGGGGGRERGDGDVARGERGDCARDLRGKDAFKDKCQGPRGTQGWVLGTARRARPPAPRGVAPRLPHCPSLHQRARTADVSRARLGRGSGAGRRGGWFFVEASKTLCAMSGGRKPSSPSQPEAGPCGSSRGR
jgi:hypothetical protein